jgi:hypothetical protein
VYHSHTHHPAGDAKFHPGVRSFYPAFQASEILSKFPLSGLGRVGVVAVSFSIPLPPSSEVSLCSKPSMAIDLVLQATPGGPFGPFVCNCGAYCTLHTAFKLAPVCNFISNKIPF